MLKLRHWVKNYHKMGLCECSSSYFMFEEYNLCFMLWGLIFSVFELQIMCVMQESGNC